MTAREAIDWELSFVYLSTVNEEGKMADFIDTSWVQNAGDEDS